jgi:hypothetical protein
VNHIRRALLAIAVCFLGPGTVLAQNSGGIRGRVVDAAGQALAGVSLSVSSRTLQVDEPIGRSDAQGRFQAIALDPAVDYLVKASLAGYATVAAPDVVVRAAQMTTVTIALPPESSVREHVKVTGKASPVDLEERGLTTHLSSEFIDNLPILGRNYQEVLTLSPGVSDVDGDGNPNIHGARDTDVGTFVDGINTTDPLTGKVGAQLNIESIQEIEVKTAGASAEFGRAQGGFANILTKSGGNDFEGAFKFFWRGSALDGDGAGQDPAELHGGIGEIGLRDLTFNDYLPFLSLSGPIVKDKAWYFATIEYIQKEEPVNAVTQAFVTGLHEQRAFVKGSLQATANSRLVLTLNDDPQEFTNQGLNSLTRIESGYTLKQGGPLVTLRDTTVMGPSAALETAVSYFDSRPGLEPNLPLDNNHDGILTYDRNGDGFRDARERDAGEDYDGDGRFDVWEDTLVTNGQLDANEVTYCFIEGFWRISPPARCRFPTLFYLDEDGFRPDPASPQQIPGDGDRRLTPPGGCEGIDREDKDCDAHLDFINEDRNHNGVLDSGEDLDGDHHLDDGTEDRNSNRRLDDTPYPESLYPYGRLAPTRGDRDFSIDMRQGVIDGPYYQAYEDQRERLTLRQDLSVFVAEGAGTHDIKGGYLVEKEQFDRDAEGHPISAVNDPGWRTGIQLDHFLHPEIHYDCNPYVDPCLDPGLGRLTAILPTTIEADQGAESLSGGVYVQDTWKPVPTVSVSLGLRFDREAATTSGYSYFTPDAERDHLDRLQALAGNEVGKDDLVGGNNDGIASFGLPSDPLYNIAPANFAPILNSLQSAANASLTLHRDSTQFSLAQLRAFFPDLIKDGAIDPVAAAAYNIHVQTPEDFRITNNNLSPRLGASWDPGGAGRTKIFGAWGRYYDRLFLNTVVGEQGIETIQRYYVLDRDGEDVIPEPGTGVVVGSVANHHYGTRISASPPTVTQVNRNLKTPYCDEWILGFEREIAPETALSVRAVQRRYRDQLQDIDVNHETRLDPVTHELSDRFGQSTNIGTADDPNLVTVPDGKPDLFVRNPFFNQVLRVGNTNTSSYGAFEVELRRRLARRWQMQGSYTYSRAQGAAEDFQSRLGNDPSTVESEYGYLDFDQRHVVKLNAGFYLPGDWQIGFATQWASGLPYSIVSRFFALDNVGYQQFRTRYGFTEAVDGKLEFQTVARNSERNDSTLNIDTSARKNFVWGRTTWAVSLEVFNLLNSDDLRVYSYEPSRTNGFDAGSATLIATPLQLDAERRFGRRFQIGFQFSF